MRTFTLLALAATIGACDEGLQIPELEPRTDTIKVAVTDTLVAFNRYGIEATNPLNGEVVRFPTEADHYLQWVLPVAHDTIYVVETDTVYIDGGTTVVRLYCYLKEPHHDSYVCQGSPR